jgi:periplasmic protein TonB
MADQLAYNGPLWATDIKEDNRGLLSLPKALLFALALELIVLAVLVVNWRALLGKEEPPPMQVEFVKITPPPAPEPPPQPEIKREEPPPPPPEPPKKLEPIVKPEPPKPIPKPKPTPLPKPVLEPTPIKQPELPPEPVVEKPPPEPVVEEPPKVEEPPPAPPPPPEPVAQPTPEPTPPAPPPQPVQEVPQTAPVEAAPPAPAEPEPPKQKRSGKPIYKVRAVYPKSALREGVEGRVKMRLTVSEHGTVTNVEILDSNPPGVFDNVASDAVKQYKFEPGNETLKVDQLIVFKLEEQ